MKYKQKITISIALIVGINLIAIFGWWFIYSGIQQKRDAIAALRREIDINERRMNNSRSLGVLLTDVKSDEEKITATFLNSNNIVKFIEDLEFLSRKASTTLEVDAIKLPTPEDDIQKPAFHFKITGVFSELFQYFTLLENLPYQIEIERVSLINPKTLNLVGITNTKKSIPIWEAEFDIKLLSYENI